MAFTRKELTKFLNELEILIEETHIYKQLSDKTFCPPRGELDEE